MSDYYTERVKRYIRPENFQEVVDRVLKDGVLEIPNGICRTIQNLPVNLQIMSKVFRIVIESVSEKTVKVSFYGKTRYGKEVELLKTARLKRDVAEHEIYAFATGRDNDLSIELGRVYNYKSDKILELQKKKEAIDEEARRKVKEIESEIEKLFNKEFEPVLKSGDLDKADEMASQFREDCGSLASWKQQEVFFAKRDENIKKGKGA